MSLRTTNYMTARLNQLHAHAHLMRLMTEVLESIFRALICRIRILHPLMPATFSGSSLDAQHHKLSFSLAAALTADTQLSEYRTDRDPAA